MMHARFVSSFLLASTTLLSACGDPESGALTVGYELGPGGMDACDQFDVDTVRAILGENRYEQTVDCGQELVFSNVDAGIWTLVVEAENANGLVVMDNVDGERVEVVAGVAKEFETRLTATPVRVFVNWILGIGDTPGVQCSDPSNPFEQFEVTAWDGSGTALLTHVFPCDAPTEEGVYRRVPDMTRQIRGNLLQEVAVQPQTEDGTDVSGNVRFMLDEPPGPGRELYLTVSCDVNTETCEASATPPYDMP